MDGHRTPAREGTEPRLQAGSPSLGMLARPREQFGALLRRSTVSELCDSGSTVARGLTQCWYESLSHSTDVPLHPEVHAHGTTPPPSGRGRARRRVPDRPCWHRGCLRLFDPIVAEVAPCDLPRLHPSRPSRRNAHVGGDQRVERPMPSGLPDRPDQHQSEPRSTWPRGAGRTEGSRRSYWARGSTRCEGARGPSRQDRSDRSGRTTRRCRACRGRGPTGGRRRHRTGRGRGPTGAGGGHRAGGSVWTEGTRGPNRTAWTDWRHRIDGTGRCGRSEWGHRPCRGHGPARADRGHRAGGTVRPEGARGPDGTARTDWRVRIDGSGRCGRCGRSTGASGSPGSRGATRAHRSKRSRGARGSTRA